MNPIDGQPLLVAAAKASVGPQRLPDLLARVQSRLAPDLETYRRTCERVYAIDECEVFLADPDHWADLGAAMGLSRREHEAVARAHAEHLRTWGGDATGARSSRAPWRSGRPS